MNHDRVAMNSESDNYSSNFTDARALAAEGARVGLVTCKTCGSALVIDMADDFNVLETHAEWHRSVDRGRT